MSVSCVCYTFSVITAPRNASRESGAWAKIEGSFLVDCQLHGGTLIGDCEP